MNDMLMLQHHFDMFEGYVDVTDILRPICRPNNSSSTIIHHEDLSRLGKGDLVIFEGDPKKGNYILTEKGKRLLEEVRR